MRCLQRLLAAAATCIVASAVCASPCLPGTVDDYLSAGSCDIDGATLSDFSLGSIPFGAVEVDPAAVIVTPVDGPLGPSLILTFETSAANAQFFDLLLHFTATAMPGTTFFGHGASIDARATGDGAVTLIQDACVGSLFIVAPVGCFAEQSTIIPIVTDLASFPGDQAAFTPTTLVDVSADFGIDAGLAGTAFLASGAVQLFTQPFSTPEPGSAAMMAMAVGVLALAMRRRIRAPIR